MDPQAEPPKRATRARATGKTSTATAGTASSAARKTATAATKTKTTRTTPGPAASSSTVAASSTRTSTKRKTRPDDHDDDSEDEQPAKLPSDASRPAVRATRGPGRPRKIVDSKPAPTPATAAPRAPRGRPPKKPVTEPVKEEPAKSTRTRAKRAKVDHDEDADDLAPETVKKPGRGRPVGFTTSTRAPASKAVKTVTFAEPNKENVLPLTGSKAKTPATKPAIATTATAGMQAKPVRKPVATGRATKSTTTKNSAKEHIKENTRKTGDKASRPLGPKKVTQLSATRDQDVESEDELAMDRSPARPLHRNPLKPPVSMKPPVEPKAEPEPTDEDTADLPPPEPTVILGSPARRPPPSAYKDSMKSPAKRIEGLQLGFSAIKESSEEGASSSKAPLIQSPAKRCPVSIKPVDFGSSIGHDQSSASSFKQSLFQSPARRLFSPMKSAKLPGPETEPEVVAQTPSKRVPNSPAEEAEGFEASNAGTGPVVDNEAKDGEDTANLPTSGHNGRMAEILPHEADTALVQETSLAHESMEKEGDHDSAVFEDEYEQVDMFTDEREPMEMDEPEQDAENTIAESISTTPPNSPPQQAFSMFGLREKDQVSFDQSYSESEGEITRVVTPQSTSPVKHMKGSIMKPRTSGLGFTPLAQRFDSWQTRSPLKTKFKAATPTADNSTASGEVAAVSQDSPMGGDFFEDEMASWPDEAADDSGNEPGPLSEIAEIKEPVLEDISLTEEDFDLAAESNEMSVMSPEQIDSMRNLDQNEDAVSEASQEYGDENEVPDANARSGTPIPPVTPQRYTAREFHTVSKIPLKEADESTPPPQPDLKMRRHSISQVPETRPTHGLTRSATVISYSPSHKKHVEAAFEEAAEEEEEESRSRAGSLPPVTPTKSENWSNAGSPPPVQSPHREADPTLLRGAVVFVDVHTMEGADASAIFVELLTQMGARCIKHWTWNPNDEDASSKIGITHVVYKDGGKRTMERVRATGGVVQCVGVGWVLDCERENEWLDEAPYYIDTSLVPRGGARRRKSMEPKTLANVNGTVISEPASRRTSTRESQAAPSTPAPANRRDSTMWMHSPDDQEMGDDEGHENDGEFNYEHEWFNSAPLTPVPKTPAPEAIHRFAMDLTPDMNSPMTEAGDDDGDQSREQLIQRTCPPKTQHMYEDLGAGILGRNKDENVARRLMDARRKSLAFAPKVSSPLAKSWKEWN